MAGRAHGQALGRLGGCGRGVALPARAWRRNRPRAGAGRLLQALGDRRHDRVLAHAVPVVHQLGEDANTAVDPRCSAWSLGQRRAVGAVADGAHLALASMSAGAVPGRVPWACAGAARMAATPAGNDGRYATRQHGFPPRWVFSVSDDSSIRRWRAGAMGRRALRPPARPAVRPLDAERQAS